MPYIPTPSSSRNIYADIGDMTKWTAKQLKEAVRALGRPMTSHEAEEEKKRLASLYWRMKKNE